jgi:eukaryotic-like serine/threonine-protein kinase
LFKFITHRPFWLNLLVTIALAAGLLLLFLASLDFFTKHGKSHIVPSVKGKNIAEAKKLLEAKGFEVEILDSAWIDTLPRLSVLKQFPEPDATVKVNRRVFLTINRAAPPIILMPNLVGLSITNAQMYLKQYGLQLGDTLFKPDYAKNAILEQLYNGAGIKPGAKIPMGSRISFIIGSGVSDIDFDVPDLVGMTFSDAKAAIESSGLMLASVVPDPDVRDTLTAFVYKQNPERLDYQKKIRRIRQGNTMDLWLSVERKILADSLSQQQVPDAGDNNNNNLPR